MSLSTTRISTSNQLPKPPLALNTSTLPPIIPPMPVAPATTTPCSPASTSKRRLPPDFITNSSEPPAKRQALGDRDDGEAEVGTAESQLAANVLEQLKQSLAVSKLVSQTPSLDRLGESQSKSTADPAMHGLDVETTSAVPDPLARASRGPVRAFLVLQLATTASMVLECVQNYKNPATSDDPQSMEALYRLLLASRRTINSSLELLISAEALGITQAQLDDINCAVFCAQLFLDPEPSVQTFLNLRQSFWGNFTSLLEQMPLRQAVVTLDIDTQVYIAHMAANTANSRSLVLPEEEIIEDLLGTELRGALAVRSGMRVLMGAERHSPYETLLLETLANDRRESLLKLRPLADLRKEFPVTDIWEIVSELVRRRGGNNCIMDINSRLIPGVTSSYQLYQKVCSSPGNQKYKDIASASGAWKPEQTQVLLDCLDQLSTPHWKAVLALHGTRGSVSDVLDSKTEAQLQEHAGNIKAVFIATQRPIPRSFRRINPSKLCFDSIPQGDKPHVPPITSAVTPAKHDTAAEAFASPRSLTQAQTLPSASSISGLAASTSGPKLSGPQISSVATEAQTIARLITPDSSAATQNQTSLTSSPPSALSNESLALSILKRLQGPPMSTEQQFMAATAAQPGTNNKQSRRLKSQNLPRSTRDLPNPFFAPKVTTPGSSRAAATMPASVAQEDKLSENRES